MRCEACDKIPGIGTCPACAEQFSERQEEHSCAPGTAIPGSASSRVSQPPSVGPKAATTTPPASASGGGTADALLRDLATGGLTLAAIAVVSAVTTLLVVLGTWVMGSASARGTTEIGAGFNDLAALWVQLMGLPLFGGANLTAAGGASSVFVQYLPGFMTLAVVAAAYLLHSHRSRSYGRPALAARSAAAASVGPVLVVLLLTTLAPMTSGTWRLAVHPAALFFLGILVLFCVGYVAQARREPGLWGPLRTVLESGEVRRAGVALSTHAVVSAVLMLLCLGGYLLFAGSWRTSLGLALLAPLIAAAPLVVGIGLAHGGSVTAAGAVGYFGGSQTTHLLSLGVSRWMLLLLLVPLIATSLAGLRVGLGMPAGWHGQWRDVWVTPLALFLGWLAIDTVLGQVAIQGSAFDVPLLGTLAGNASVGPSFSTSLIVGLWGMVVEVNSRVLAPAALRVFPSLPALLMVRPWAPVRAAAGTVAVAPPGRAGVGTHIEPGVELEQTSPRPFAEPIGETNLTTTLTGGPAPTLTPQQRRRLRIVSGFGAGAIGLIATLVAAVNWIGTTYFGPQPVVEEYLTALRDGDAAKAAELADPGIPNSSRAGLSSAVLSSATHRISAFFVSEPTIADSVASVRVQYSVDGEAVSTTMRLERAGSRFGFFPVWRLTSNLANRVSVRSPVGISIGDTQLAAVPVGKSDSGESTLYLYPGIYHITGAKGTPVATWINASTEQLRVTSVSSIAIPSVHIGVTPTSRLTDEVTKSMRTLIDECAKTGAARPQVNGVRCPFSTYSSDDKATWSVLSYPELEIGVDSSSGRVRVSSTKSGSMRVTTKFFGDSSYTSTETVTILSRSMDINSDGTLAWAN